MGFVDSPLPTNLGYWKGLRQKVVYSYNKTHGSKVQEATEKVPQKVTQKVTQEVTKNIETVS